MGSHKARRRKGCRAPAEKSNFALSYETLESRDDGIGVRNTYISDMKLVQVDVVCLESSQRSVESTFYISGIIANSRNSFCRLITYEAEFSCKDLSL